jgi:hypothetical protein
MRASAFKAAIQIRFISIRVVKKRNRRHRSNYTPPSSGAGILVGENTALIGTQNPVGHISGWCGQCLSWVRLGLDGPEI